MKLPSYFRTSYYANRFSFIDGLWSEERFQSLGPVGFFAALLIIYNAVLPFNLSASHDSISYLEDIANSQTPWLLHPHHLLYAVVGRAFWLLWKLFGYSGDPLLPLQELNIFFGSLSIAIFYRFLIKVLKNQWISLAICLAIAFSYGFWFYSSVIEVYIVPFFFLLISFRFVYLTHSDPKTRLFALIGIFHALAILFHQMHVLFSFVVIVSVAINSDLPSRYGKIRAFISYLSFLLVPVSAAYLLALFFIVEPSSVEGAYYWFTSYLHQGQWGKVETTSFIKAFVGFGNSIIGGQFLFAAEPFSRILSNLFANKFVVSYQFLVRNIRQYEAYILLASCAPFGVTVVTSVALHIRSRKRIREQYGLILFLCLSWFIPYATFNTWWEPSNLEFWIVLLPPFWIGISIPYVIVKETLVGFLRSAIMCLLPITIVCILFVNLFGSILPLHRPEDDYYYQKALWYIGHAKKTDMIICGRSWVWGSYLNRYTNAEVIGLAETLVSKKKSNKEADKNVYLAIKKVLNNGGVVYVTSDAVEPEQATLEAFGLELGAFSDFWQPYKPYWIKQDIKSQDKTYILRKR